MPALVSGIDSLVKGRALSQTAIWVAVSALAAGSIPFGYLVALSRGRDIRQEGSGNIGATNVGRVLGKPYAILVFALDFLKGFIPAWVAHRWFEESMSGAGISWTLSTLAALLAVLGHMYSPFLKFRGGKGVATGFGAFVALAPGASLGAFGTWILALLLFGFVSLASLLASGIFPLLAWVLGYGSHIVFAGIVITLLITWRHRSNISRLLRGEEPRKGRKRRSTNSSLETSAD